MQYVLYPLLIIETWHPLPFVAVVASKTKLFFIVLGTTTFLRLFSITLVSLVLSFSLLLTHTISSKRSPWVLDPLLSQLEFSGLGVIKILCVSVTTFGLGITLLQTYIIWLRQLNLAFWLLLLLHQLIVWLNGIIITTLVLFLTWMVVITVVPSDPGSEEFWETIMTFS